MIEKTKQEIEDRYRIENGYEHNATVMRNFSFLISVNVVIVVLTRLLKSK